MVSFTTKLCSRVTENSPIKSDYQKFQMEDTSTLLYGVKIVTNKTNAKWDLGAIFDHFKDVLPDDIPAWPRWSLATQDITVSNNTFLELEFPEETAKIAADEKRAEYQDKYRKFFFPEIYAVEEFSRLVKRKLLEKRNGEKAKCAKLLNDIQKSKTQKDKDMKMSEEEKYDEKEDEKEITKIEDVVLLTSDTHKAEKRKSFLSCFCF